MQIGLDGIHSRIDSAMQAADMAWWEMELPSGVIFFHENKTTMLGYDSSAGFVHYKNFTELIHPEDLEPSMEAMRQHMRGDVPLYKTIYRILGRDGNYHTFFDRGKIVAKDADGNMKVAGVVVDITDEIDNLAAYAKTA